MGPVPPCGCGLSTVFCSEIHLLREEERLPYPEVDEPKCEAVKV